MALITMETSTPDWVFDTSTEIWNETNATYSPDISLRERHVCYMVHEGDEVLRSYTILMFWSLIAVFVGLVANTLNVLVFSARDMLNASSNVYLMALAVSDSLFLIFFALGRGLTYVDCLYLDISAIDIYNRSEVMCIFLQYMMDLFSDYSALVILAFTLERYIACYHAIQFREWCTVYRSRLLCIIMFVAVAIVISPYHIAGMGHPKNPVTGETVAVCTIMNNRYGDIFSYLYMVETIILRVIPIMIIAVLNVLIIIKITEIHNKRKERQMATKMARKFSTPRANSTKNTAKEDKHLQMTIMLILVSTSYIVLYIPVLVHYVMQRLTQSEVITLSTKTDYLVQNYTTLLDISGFAINFFLYTISGKIFRNKLISIICNDKFMAYFTSTTRTKTTKSTAEPERGRYEPCDQNEEGNFVGKNGKEILNGVGKHGRLLETDL